MRALLIASLAVWSLNSFAFDGPKVIESYNDARPACRQAELHGKPISVADSAKQCDILAKLAQELKENGYCWNATEQDWAVCK
jgi:hypothetical protein